MNKLYRHRAILRGNFFAFIGVCLSLYFCFHALQGERGFLHQVVLEQKIEVLEKDSEKLTAVREELEQKVAMMRPGSVDRDLLEERVRLQLGYKHQDEYDVLNEVILR